MRRYIVSTFLAATLALPTVGRAATTWEIDPAHTSAGFAIRHLMVSTVRGDFRKVSGKVNLDEQDVTKSTIEATIDVASVDTGIVKRDDHLRSPDFFDVAKHPAMTFKSKKIQKGSSDGNYKITGDLTLHGVTKEVVLDFEGSLKPVKSPQGKTIIGGMATTKINRKDFGLTWNAALETGGVAVGEEVTITVDIELTQAAATAAVTPGTVSEAAQKTVEKAADKAMDKAAGAVVDKAMDKAMPNPLGR
ncbi:MAG: YceI family protein [Deltaproteobacteria bacterium]|nr:YceI family protein [Deltaproteobacteria bacterium]